MHLDCLGKTDSPGQLASTRLRGNGRDHFPKVPLLSPQYPRVLHNALSVLGL